MQQDNKIIVEILRKFQWHFRTLDVCRLSFAELFNLLTIEQQRVLLSVCELDKDKVRELDTQVPAKNMLVVPYKASLYGRRFVRVTPSLWDSFCHMSVDLQRYNGKKIKIVSGYRSPAYQSLLYLKKIYRHNFDLEKTKRLIKLPGQSEHQDYKKLAVDIGDSKHTHILSKASYYWLLKNAAKYNFINSYPKDINKDGISFEPWHWRFFS